MPHTPCYVRGGTSACKWQIALVDLSESELERLRTGLRQHCIESHGPRCDDPLREVWFDLEHYKIRLPGS